MASKRAIKSASGRHTEMADADTVVAGFHAQIQTVASGQTMNVPAGYSVAVVGALTVDGDLQLDGDMAVI